MVTRCKIFRHKTSSSSPVLKCSTGSVTPRTRTSSDVWMKYPPNWRGCIVQPRCMGKLSPDSFHCRGDINIRMHQILKIFSGPIKKCLWFTCAFNILQTKGYLIREQFADIFQLLKKYTYNLSYTKSKSFLFFCKTFAVFSIVSISIIINHHPQHRYTNPLPYIYY